MDQRETDSKAGKPRVPHERNDRNPSHIHEPDRSRSEDREQGENAQVHDEGFPENNGIGNFLEHSSLHYGDGPVHSCMDQAVEVIGARAIERNTAGGLACAEEIR